MLSVALTILLAGSQVVGVPDSMAVDLNEVEAVGNMSSSVRHIGPGRLRINTDALQRQLRQFGEADVVARLKQEPGIGSAGDFGSGIAVDGAEPSQTVYRVAKVPVFFPYRFGGLFSVFNSAHFASADFERGVHTPEMPARLGAKLDFEPYSRVEDLTATVNVGMLGSGVTLRGGVRDRLWAVASGRVSYVDELYGPLLEGNATYIKYRFADFNVTLGCNLDSINSLSVNGLVSHDRLGYDDRHYAMDMALRWRNTALSLQWERRGKVVAMRHRAFYTGFHNRMTAVMPQLSIALPAGISAAGLSGEADFRRFHCGYELQLYESSDPVADIEGYGQRSDDMAAGCRYQPVEIRLFGGYELPVSTNFMLNMGISVCYYQNRGYRKFAPDPRITLTYNRGPQTITFHCGIYHQYLHQAGFSEIGLASDFWICSRRSIPAQSAAGITAEYAREIAPGLSLDASAYWRRVWRQAEYDGLLLDLTDRDYNVDNHISQASGHNWGVDVAMRLYGGAINAMAAVGYGGTLRHFPGEHKALPARTDPGVSVKLNADWSIDRHWSVGGNFVFNTGRRYTPARAMYLIADNLICEYGERNSAMMPAYHRLDLSASYLLRRGRFRHIFNFSLINAYGHRNVEMQTFVIDAESGAYRLRRTYSLYRFLPSVSYTLKF